MDFKEINQILNDNLTFGETYFERHNLGIQDMFYKGTQIGWLRTFAKNIFSPIIERYIAIIPDTYSNEYKGQLSKYDTALAEDEGYTQYILTLNNDNTTDEEYNELVYEFCELMYQITVRINKENNTDNQ